MLSLVKHSTIYITVYTSIIKILDKKLTKFNILKKLRNLENIYNNKLTSILLKLRREDYIIKFQNNNKKIYISLLFFTK